MIISNCKLSKWWRNLKLRFVLLLLFSLAPGSAAPASDRLTPAAVSKEQSRLEQYLQDHPDSVPARQAYADFLSDHGQLRAAILQWRTAQLLQPGRAAIANSLGGAYLRMGRAADSAAQFARAIGLDADNAAYHFNLANVEFLLRRDLTSAWKMEEPHLLHLALGEFREASRLSPHDVDYARAYAETFYGMPDPDWTEAEAAWKHVLSLSPQGDFAYLQLARVSLKQGHADRTREFLKKITDTRHDTVKRKLQARADRR